jgi:hypothetical protein
MSKLSPSVSSIFALSFALLLCHRDSGSATTPPANKPSVPWKSAYPVSTVSVFGLYQHHLRNASTVPFHHELLPTPEPTALSRTGDDSHGHYASRDDTRATAAEGEGHGVSGRGPGDGHVRLLLASMYYFTSCVIKLVLERPWSRRGVPRGCTQPPAVATNKCG